MPSARRPLFTVRQAVALHTERPRRRVVADPQMRDCAGVLLAPGLPPGETLAPGEALRLRRPDGTALVVVTRGKSIPSRKEPHQGVRAYPVQVGSAVLPADVPRGTEVWRMES